MEVPEGLISYLWVVLCAVLAPGLLGAGIVRVLGLRWDQGRRAFLAWSYLTGQFAMAPVTFGWLFLHKPLPGWSLVAFALVVGAVLLLWARARETQSAQVSAPRKADGPMVLVTCVCLALLFDNGLVANLEPVSQADEADIWAAKAKVLYSVSSLANDSLDLQVATAYHLRHADYPLLNPLVQVLSFASADRVLFFENRVPIQAFGVALLLLLSASLRRYCRWPVAGLLLLAFTGTSFLYTAVSAYADVMLALAVFAAFDGWARWRETHDVTHWRLACIALGVAVASKNEGIMLALVFGLALALGWVLQRWFSGPLRPGLQWRACFWLLVPLVTIWLGVEINGYYGLVNDLHDPAKAGGQGLFERVATRMSDRGSSVLAFYGDLLITMRTGGWLLSMFLLSALLFWRRTLASLSLQMWLFVCGAIAAYMLVFVGTHFDDLLWHLSTAAERTLLHVLPVAVVGLGFHLGETQVLAPPQSPVGVSNDEIWQTLQ